MKFLVTGTAGFIGFHLTNRLLTDQHEVIGIDNLNDYYDVQLKLDRLEILKQNGHFFFIKMDIAEKDAMQMLFEQHHFDVVINLAAQAGVRHSLTHPHDYTRSNVEGFLNILEGCRDQHIKHLVFASTSSVYGANTQLPFSEHHNTDHPIAVYAATKKVNELMAHGYASLYNLPCTGLRFFTVYGPWGRPDMALFKFTKNILAGEPIDIYNNGKMIRDFTYVDDIVEGIVKVSSQPPQANPQWDSHNPDPATSYAPYKIYNLGNGNPVELMTYIKTIEQYLQKKAIYNYQPMQDGDIKETSADTTLLQQDFGYTPKITVQEGIKHFLDWYQEYYHE